MWQLRAACAQPDCEVTVAEFDELCDNPRMNVPGHILALCTACPVRQECLEEALSYLVTQDFGIRGGYTEDQRRGMPRHVVERRSMQVATTTWRRKWKRSRRAQGLPA